MVHNKHRRKLNLRFVISAALLFFSGSIALSKVKEEPNSNLTSITELTSNNETVLSAEGPLAEAVAAFLKGDAAQDDRLKLAHYLTAAENLFTKALENANEKASRERAIYSASCAEAAVIIHRLAGSDLPVESVTAGDKTYRVKLHDIQSGRLLQQEYVVSSDKMIVHELKKEVKQSGLGGTLIGYLSKDSPQFVDDPNVPPEGRTLGFTSVLIFEDSSEVRLEIYDPGKQDEINIEGRRHRLAADFSGPLDLLVSKSLAKKMGKKGFHNPEEQEWLRGLFFIEPYRPEKIPVILIHGLHSAPITWLDLYLELIVDKRLRMNFQYWVYRYPTGYPIGRNARDFRVTFNETIMRHDPDGKNLAFQNMVLVGHSMGGLISSAAVRDSGDTVWNLISDRSIDSLDIDEEVRDELESMVFFDPLPQVSRVVFMATPHRGSKLAKGFAGKLAAALVDIPVDLLNPDDPQLNENFTDFGKKIIKQKQTSIDGLRPDTWQLATLLDLPMSERVTYHSIIGNNRKKPFPIKGDGVVPYWSSHLDGATSERVVKSGHGVHRHPEAIAELKRILYLHLNDLGR